jgi:hypothetical protein
MFNNYVRSRTFERLSNFALQSSVPGGPRVAPSKKFSQHDVRHSPAEPCLVVRDCARLAQQALRVEPDANEHIKPLANLRHFLLSNKLRPLDPSLKREPDEVWRYPAGVE